LLPALVVPWRSILGVVDDDDDDNDDDDEKEEDSLAIAMPTHKQHAARIVLPPARFGCG